jgi:hypothetical protein
MKNDARIRAALNHAAGRPCLLCGSESDYACTWVPSDAYYEVFAQPPDEREQMAFGYALCSSCRSDDDVRGRIAATLARKWGKPCDD